jgi:hypothetical protein
MRSYHNSAHKQRGSLESLIQTPSLTNAYIIGDELPDPDSSRLWMFNDCTLRSVRGPRHTDPANRTKHTLRFYKSKIHGLWVDQNDYTIVLEESELQTMGALGSTIELYTDTNSSVEDIRTNKETRLTHTSSAQYFATLE